MRKRTFHAMLALLIGLFVIAPANAQDRRQDRRADPRQRIERRVAFLDQKLDLTDAQEAQIQRLLAEQHEAAEAWRQANPNASREERQAHRAGQREATRAAIEGVLTPEQQQILEELKPGEGRMRRGHPGPRGGGPAQRLELTDEQQTQLREIMQAHREAAKAWRDANPEATREERRAHRQAQHEAMETALKGVLTPQQLEQMERLRARRQERFGERWGRRGRAGSQSGDAAPKAGAANETTESAQFDLSNYPNPFNPSTEIRFDLPESAHVSLVVYDVQGREVATLVDEQLGAGAHAATFDATGLPTGTYLYRLTVGTVTETGRMVLMK